MSNLDHTYIILITRVLSGEASESDRREFNQWLDQSSENRDIFRQYKAVWQLSDLPSQDIKPDRQSAWTQVQRRIEQKESHSETTSTSPIKQNFSRTRIIPLHRKLYAATAIAAGILLFVAFYFMFTEQQAPLIAVKAEKFTGEPLILPDGSNVYLQADAAIHYPENFQRKKREVALTGNAYFEIVSVDSPFMVLLEDAVVEVVGTSFEIIQDKNKEITRVSVTKGMVKLHSTLFSGPGILLKAGEGAKLDHSKQTSTNFLIQDQNFLAWKTGELVFHNEPLDQVILILEETYQISIDAPHGIQYLQLTGRFIHETPDDILTTISMVFNFDLEISNGTYMIYSKDNQ